MGLSGTIVRVMISGQRRAKKKRAKIDALKIGFLYL